VSSPPPAAGANLTELTAARIEQLLAASDGPIVEAVPGMFLMRVCDSDECAEIVARCDRATWSGATINADRSIDRSVRDADVVDETANPELIEHVRALLFAATRTLAAALVPGTVLAEVQIVRYGAGGRYVDHRDTPAGGATPRALSLVWYLNAGLQGGETRFSDPDIVVSPVSGVAIAFAPVLMHRAEPVAAGTKYAVTAWYHELPFA
jgi:predicted 2-oxoglutarate/Fe(II)-dependent dioxygenase YbiX